MTKILLTAVVADMRNSMAGTTFSKGRYGNYMKTKAIPCKRNTSFQNAWRANQAYTASKWRTLSESDRQSWVNATSNYPVTDKFGNTIYLSGYDLYLRQNLSAWAIGFNLIPDFAPVPKPVPAMLFPQFTIAWNQSEDMYDAICSFTTEPDSNPIYIAMYCTQPGSPGKMTMGKTKYLLGMASYRDSYANAGGNLKVAFGNPPPGQKSFFEFVVVDVATGQRSSSLSFSAIFPAHI